MGSSGNLGQQAQNSPAGDFSRIKNFTQQNQEWFHTLTIATFEGVAISQSARFINVNEQLAKMLGYEPEELIGMPVGNVIPEQDRQLVLDDIKAGRESIAEHQLLRKDGSIRLVEAHGKTITYRGFPLRMTAIRDITDVKKAENALRQSQERFRNLASATFEGIIFTDDVIILEANEQFARMLGWQLSEVIGKSILQFLGTEEHSRVREACQSGKECIGEYRCLRKDGSAFFIEAHCRGIQRMGEPYA